MSKRFVSIWFPFLVTDWFVISTPALQHKPFVVRALVKGRMVVVRASPQARAQGIFPGMVLADAQALVTDLTIVEEPPQLTERVLKLLALWCIRFTPFSGVDLPDGILLDASGCAHLWGGEDPYLTEISKRLKERGYHVRIAMADTIGAAWAMARYGQHPIIEVGEQSSALLSLPVAALRLDVDVIERLHKLGIYQLETLFGQPLSALRRRFGLPLVQRIHQALGREEETFTPVRPPEPFQERLPCLEPISTRSGIEEALRRLLILLCHRLQQEGKGLRSAVFRGYRLDSGLSQIAIETNAPSRSVAHLLKLFEIKLSLIQPESGIELFILEAHRVEDLVPQQEKLWEGTPSTREALVAELLDRLATKLGTAPIHRYLPDEHYWPERAIRKVASLQESSGAKWPLGQPRPAQLLGRPEVITVTAPIPDYPPMNFRYKGQLHKVIRADGPERIEQEWWLQEGEHRDYYRVEDEAGRRYWIFRRGHYGQTHSPQWFLHGFFP